MRATGAARTRPDSFKERWNRMEIQSILQKFRKRLVWEGILRAAVCGIILGCGLGALIMAVSWLSTARPGLIPLLPAFNGTRLAPAIGLGVSLVAAVLLYLLRFRPTLRDAARRVDALGLEERAVTMLDAAGEDDLIPTLQRADATARLAQVPRTRLRFAIRRLTAIIACVCVLCMAATVIIPNAYGLYTPLTEEEIIDRLLEELRQEIDAAEEVEEEVKDQLHDTVDDLEASLDSMESTQEKVDAIEETADRIHDILEEAADKESGDKQPGEEEEPGDPGDPSDSGEKPEQGPNEALDEELQDSISDALEQLQPGSPPEGSPSEGENGENGEGDDGSNGSNGDSDNPAEDTPPRPGDNGQGSNDNADGDGQHNQINDPYGKSFKDGKTPYTDEYDAYFKQEMARLEKADLSDAERELIARYFAAMMVEADKTPA